MLNISSKTKSHILVLIFGPHVPLWLPSIVTLHIPYLPSGMVHDSYEGSGGSRCHEGALWKLCIPLRLVLKIGNLFSRDLPAYFRI